MTVGAVLAGGLVAPTMAPGPAPAAVQVDSEAVHFARERGITPTEAAERLRWQVAVPDFAERVRGELGSTFGGFWIAVADRDRIKVGVTPAAAPTALAAVARAADEMGLAGAVDVVRVGYAESALKAANAWLAQRFEDLARRGSGGSLVTGLRPDLNAVLLETPADGATTPEERALVAEARARFGDLLRLGAYQGRPRARACNAEPFCDPPLRGGIEIHNPVPGATVICTGGFIARSKVDSRLYQFTAGHCADAASDTWSTEYTNGTTHAIGGVHNWQYPGSGDMAIVRINDVDDWDPAAWVLVTDGPDTTYDATYHISSDNLSSVGMRICTTGAVYEESSCGTVTELDVTVNYGDGSLHNLGRATFCGTGGDSGSPMFSYHVAYGLQSGGFSECDSLYQGIRDAELQMNVNVRHANS
jgi:hypothetical protein